MQSSAWGGVVRASGLGLVLSAGCVGDDDPADDAGATSSAEGTDSGGSPSADVPGNDYCAGVTNWLPFEQNFEQQVLTLVNAERSAGASCGSRPFGSAGPLTMNPALRCAARVHSLDMAMRGFFDHVNPDGEDPFVRMEQAGYTYASAGENIAAGQVSPDEVVAGWMDSPGHCSNIMDPGFVHIGVGYVVDPDGAFPHYWTQTFGSPF